MPRHNHNKEIKLIKMTLGDNCHSKRQFVNKSEAEKAAELQIMINPYLELSVYQCNSCYK